MIYTYIFSLSNDELLFGEDEQLYLDMIGMDVRMHTVHPIVSQSVLEFVIVVSIKKNIKIFNKQQQKRRTQFVH